MKTRRIAALILAAMLFGGLCAPAYASQDPDSAREEPIVTTRYTNTDTAILSLNFPNGVAEFAVKIYGITGVTKISADIKLQLKSGSSYTDVKIWPTQTQYTDIFKYTDTYSGIKKGNTYRLFVTASVTKGSVTEVVTFWTEGTY